MNKIEKQIINEEIHHNLEWEYEQVPLSQIKKDITELENLGVTHIEFDSDRDGLCISLIKQREETDKEFSKRLEYIKKREEAIKEQELKQLESLRKKYNV